MNVEALMKGIAPVIREYVRLEIEKSEESLLQRIAELESRQKEFKYVGTWKSDREYQRGNFATHSGSIWHANEATSDKPGLSNSWTLACKSGDR